MEVCGRCMTMDPISWKNPALVICIPRSLGSWSRTMTRPIPALKPVSTGSEIRLATTPRRNRPASSRNAPTKSARVADAVSSAAGVAAGGHLAEDADRQDGDGRGGRHAQGAGCAHDGIHHQRDERGVETDHQRQAGNGGVGHGLGDDHGRRREAGDQIEAEPFLLIGGQPGPHGKYPGGRVHGWCPPFLLERKTGARSDVRRAEVLIGLTLLPGGVRTI